MIVNWPTKIVYYQLVKITINAPDPVKVIKDVRIKYHGLLDPIVSNGGLVFISKF